ncbi:MAG: phytanoyl-CoA dioxygenase family protein, partial [Gammaproteobacteria bacterium]
AYTVFVQRNIFPQREDFDFTTAVHQDRVHIGGATSYAKWVPLSDCPLEKGPLAVASGSHRAGVLETRVGQGAGAMEIRVPIPGTWVCGPFATGDVLVFSDTTVHQALPNRSAELRQSFDARYQPATQPIAECNMTPYAGNGTWEQVHATWESSRDQYYWRELEPNVVPFETSYYERRDAMAFEMGEHGDVTARDALLRIVQRDANSAKRTRAERLLARLEVAAQ